MFIMWLLDPISMLPFFLWAFTFMNKLSRYLSSSLPLQISVFKPLIQTVHDFNISSLQLSRSRLCRFRASSGKKALLYGLSLSFISLPGSLSFPLPLLWLSRAWARLLSSASLCKRSARNLSMELEITEQTFCYCFMMMLTTSLQPYPQCFINSAGKSKLTKGTVKSPLTQILHPEKKNKSYIEHTHIVNTWAELLIWYDLLLCYYEQFCKVS